jgi:DNA polymerase-3 subunit delta'
MPTGKSGDAKKDNVLERLTEEQLEEYYEQIRLKAENPYHKISMTNANQIRIASIRELKKKLLLTSSGEGRVCVIVSRADEMTTEAANAFLKTLEEPHDNVTIIITTSRQDVILPTILSRCQQLRCEPLSNSDLSNALKDRNNLTNQEANLISAFAQGSYTRAVEFLGEDMQELRENAIEFLRSMLKKKVYRVELANHIEHLTKKHDRKETELILSMILIWMRDVSNFSITGKKDNIINIDKYEILQKFTTGYRNKDYIRASEVLEIAINQLRKNVAPQLVLIRTVLELRKLFLFS